MPSQVSRLSFFFILLACARVLQVSVAWSVLNWQQSWAGSHTVLRAWDEKRSVGSPRAPSNPFKLLGLDPGADKAALRRAFKKLASTLHPDVAGTGDASAFQHVLWAYQELSDPDGWDRWSQAMRRGTRGGVDGTAKPYEDAYNELTNMWQDESRMSDEFSGDPIDEFEAQLREKYAARKVKDSYADSLRKLIEGSYEEEGVNSGRPTFRKVDAGQRVAIYYWDERDGADCDGWWIGADVGGDAVFAFNINQASMTPPGTGWRFPLRGPVDNSLRVVQGPSGLVQVSFAAA